MTKFHPLAVELNLVLEKESPALFSLLSDLGKRIFFPAGIITQSNEAKKYAKKYDATIGIATENQEPMHLGVVRDCFTSELEAREIFPYAPSRGLPKLREFWKEKIRRENPSLGTASISLPVVTSAISHGLSIIGELFFNAEDPVITPDKYWGNYRFLWATKLGAQIVEFPLFDESLSSFNFVEFEKTLSKYLGKKQNLVFNFPNNPTGYSLSQEEAKRIRDILIRYADKGSQFVVICDDAYFGMVWDDTVLQESLFAYLANAHERILAVKVDGATKEGFMWGFRVGFVTVSMKGLNSSAHEALETKIAGSIRSTISSSSLPSQSILLKSFQSPDFEKQHTAKKKILRERFQEIRKHAHDPRYSDLWDVYACQSGYFLCLHLKKVESEKLRKHLLTQYGVGTISTEKYDLRIAFSCLEKESIGDMISLTAQGVRDLMA